MELASPTLHLAPGPRLTVVTTVCGANFSRPCPRLLACASLLCDRGTIAPVGRLTRFVLHEAPLTLETIRIAARSCAR